MCAITIYILRFKKRLPHLLLPGAFFARECGSALCRAAGGKGRICSRPPKHRPTKICSSRAPPFVQRNQLAFRPLSVRNFGCGVAHLLHMSQRPRAASFQNATGRLPDDPKLPCQQSIGYLRRAAVLRRRFSRSVAGLRDGLFLLLAPGRGSLRRWAISDAPSLCLVMR